MMQIAYWIKKVIQSQKEGTVKVKNISPSPSYDGSAIADWENFKGHEATHCSRCGKPLQDNNDIVGGHVVMVPGSSIDQYIIPLCKKCNARTVTDTYEVDGSVLVRVLDINRTKMKNKKISK